MGKPRTFIDIDWYGFAGAESFSDGTEPLMDEAADFVVIIDRSGVGAMRYDAESDRSFVTRLRIDDNQAAATILAGMLTESLERLERVIPIKLEGDPGLALVLKRLGFSELEEL